MAYTPIDRLSEGWTVRRQRFLLKAKETIPTRSGRTLLRLTLGDSTGTMAGVLHDAAAELTDLSLYLPMARRPIPEMDAELQALIEAVRQPDLTRLLQAVFGDPALRDAFAHAPASHTMHHACVGGLLEHTLCVVQSVRSACGSLSEIDVDLGVTVGLLHDLGKTRAYDPISFELTDVGSLWGHLYMSASMVESAIEALEGFDGELRLRVVHGVLAHHGSLAHGSPVPPMTPEAMAVHHADSLDASVRGGYDFAARATDSGGDYTTFSRMHDARLYRPAFLDGRKPG
jgi:3'-5' exoribonuclease